MAQCVEGHLFCIACVANETSAILESSSPKVKCMDLLGCSAEFPPSELRRVLPVKILNLWERIEARHQLGAAGILTQLTECPFCNWACVLEDDDEQYFTCRNYEVCGVISCRWCRKKNHAPNACEVDEHGQHLVEEAMSSALIRNCPKCHKAFIKTGGVICYKFTGTWLGTDFNLLASTVQQDDLSTNKL